MTVSQLSELDFKTLEEVAQHTKEDAKEGIPVSSKIAIRLAAEGYAVFKPCSYLNELKRSDKYTAIALTAKGRKLAGETLKRELRVVEKKVDTMLKSLEERA